MVTSTKNKKAKKKVAKKATKKAPAKKKRVTKPVEETDLNHGHSKFDKKLIPIIKNLAYRGKTFSGIAELLDISEETFLRWRKACPDLQRALEEAKGNPLEKVEAALFERAVGYSARETKTHLTKTGEIKTKQIVKHYPPSETAIKYYLGNKDPAKWKERQEIDLGNKDGEEFNFSFNLEKKPEHRE